MGPCSRPDGGSRSGCLWPPSLGGPGMGSFVIVCDCLRLFVIVSWDVFDCFLLSFSVSFFPDLLSIHVL